jgi:hypothetical protein
MPSRCNVSGIYIAGGIAQKIQGFFEQSDFRASFDSKGRLSTFVQSIPTTLIINPDAALLGAANIEAFIDTQLLPRMYGPGYAGHRMESAANGDDLRIISPAGERYRFSMDMDTLHEGGSRSIAHKHPRSLGP